MNKRIEQGEATRQHIIAAATRLFAAHGYEGTSIETLLAKLGISRGALYHHFASKDALFEAVLDEVEAEVARRLADFGRGIGDPVKALRAGCAAWLDLAGDDVVRRIVLIDAPAVVGWQRWREIDERHSLGLLKAGLMAAAKHGRMRVEMTDVLARMLMATLIEAAMVIARAEDPGAARRTAAAALDRLIAGIVA